MKYHSESILAHPRDAVFVAYRDRLTEIAAYLEDIAAVNVISRAEDGAIVKMHNEWVSDRSVPTVAKSFIKPEHLRWDDHATWDANSFTVRFDIKTRVFTDAVRCFGTNTFVAEGDKTRIILDGDFDVNLREIPGVPRLLAGTIKPQVEKFIIGLIQPNLEKTNDAVGRFLSAQG